MANKLYINQETIVTWKVSGGTEIMDLGSTDGDSKAGCVGERHDWGTAARSEWFWWSLFLSGFDTPPVVGEEIKVYNAWGNDGTEFEGPVLAVDAADVTLASTNLLTNMHFLDSLKVWSTTAADKIFKMGVCRIPTRYVAPVVFNDTVDKLLSTADAHVFSLAPIPPELQP